MLYFEFGVAVDGVASITMLSRHSVLPARGNHVPDYPCYSSGDDDPVRMGCCPRAGVGQTFGQGIELVAAVEAPGEAGEVALGVLRADAMIGAGGRGLDVA